MSGTGKEYGELKKEIRQRLEPDRIAYVQPVVIIETLKAEEEKKVRKAELAKEFPFKKRGFRKHVR